jgi:hypothetical protein
MKMIIKEKIENETPKKVSIYLEGVFWVAYERSAYYIWKMKGYKPTKKHVKMMNADVVSVGFPKSVTVDLPLEIDEPNRKVFTLKEEVETSEFEKWKTDMDLQPDHHQKAEVSGIGYSTPKTTMNEIVEKIRHFDLSNATAVECLVFLSVIKKGIGINEAIGTMEVFN